MQFRGALGQAHSRSRMVQLTVSALFAAKLGSVGQDYFRTTHTLGISEVRQESVWLICAVLPPNNVGKARDVVAARPREPARYRNPPAPAVGRLSNGHYTLVSTSWSCLPNSRSSGHFAMTAAMSTPLMSWARP